MENIILKTSHLKHLKICTESDNQYISVLPVRIHVVDIHSSVQNREMLYLTLSVFSPYETHFHGVVFILLP